MITLWHNPRCTKSRQALALLEGSGANVTVRKYLEDAPSWAELDAVRAALGFQAIDMMRTGEAQFKDLGLTVNSDADTLMRAMADHPILIERPIAISGTRAVIARPPEVVRALL